MSQRQPPPSSRDGRPAVAVVVKRTALERYLETGNGRVEALLAAGDPTVANVVPAHEEHSRTLAEVRDALADFDVEVTRMRSFRNGFDAAPFDLVITVGGDGTALHTSHSIGSHTPLLAINSSPTYSVGFFCGARTGDVHEKIAQALDGSLTKSRLTRLQVTLNGHVESSRVLNDALVCHQSPAATSRYILELGDVVEEQKSSGFWIGPAAGSTAAQRSAGGRVLPFTSKKLQLVVREPYTAFGEEYLLQKVLIKDGEVLRVRSKSREMRIFIDGTSRIVKVGLGDVVELTQSPEPLILMGISPRREKAD